ncbi:tyrosine--tRNA ligase [Spiroplasma endosymbiont of Aspidapion aeneum]|uniref:tyrosine--tRNA ligase n=1 Tax=Spiroplasma endosymbiont of Aspidapion aeneum TaxID=3066276 RepID=UPI00313F01F7
MKRNIFEEFEIRGIVKDCSNKDKLQQAVLDKSYIYIGFDPTADSMHIGHLVQILLLKRFKSFGLKPLIVLGGGTGRIGDPSFKKDERPLLNNNQIEKNVNGMKKQFERFLPDIKIVNNGDWLNDFLMTDFLRDVGKRFTLAPLIKKDAIASRIDKGLSITEFFYTMLQAYDFYQLYTKYDCRIQCGGSDQWGNIMSGLDLISSYVGNDNSKAVGLTTNLITKKNGQKFGKTESGAIWLDRDKTSDYEFYQFFLNQDDIDTANQLRWLSFLEYEEIKNLDKKANDVPHEKLMQKQLADEITTFVRGDEGLKNAQQVSEALFKNDINKLNELQIKNLSGITIIEIESKLDIITFLTKSGICSSNRESRLMIKDKSILINGKQVDNENIIINNKIALFDKYLIIKKGKRNFYKIILN